MPFLARWKREQGLQGRLPQTKFQQLMTTITAAGNMEELMEANLGKLKEERCWERGVGEKSKAGPAAAIQIERE